jgi:inner membrane protein
LDNLTHSLVGAALAQVILPHGASAPHRRFFLAAGVVAANLPDLDLAYVGITPPPLGYLLHHRGHTHTLVGLALQGLMLAAACLAIPWIRRVVAAPRGRLGVLIAAGLLTHVLLDASNSYGVHPFHPLDSGWYYGDAVFILEPWLWTLLGVPVAWNAGGRLARAAVFAPIVLLPVLMSLVGIIGAGPLAAVAVGGVVFAGLTWPLAARMRAAVSLAAGTGFIALLFGLSARAEARTRTLVGPSVSGELVDVVLNPNPADPLCWMAIAVERHAAADEFVLHRGTLSLAPSWRRATRCASYRLMGGRTDSGNGSAWETPIRGSLGGLRDRDARDCQVRAWLQFGRAPAFRDGEIYDLRFDNGRGNFTSMRLQGDPAAAGCPPYLTSWDRPRADLLDGAGSPSPVPTAE